jgi:nicotinamidase/pyrazinamidase
MLKSEEAVMTANTGRTVYLQEGDALVVNDVQNCFLPGGSLGVWSGDEVIAPLNKVIMIFQQLGLPIFFTRDWHPANHCSFQEQGGPWPVHCVAYTEGSDFAADLIIPENRVIISKGTDRNYEEYSSFRGKDYQGVILSEHLERLKIRRVFIGGLATDYCILNSVIDLRAAGYDVIVLIDGIRAVNVKPADEEKALNEMRRSGAVFMGSSGLQG